MRARHLYEIIREAHPSHLYFDLEFRRAHNPGLNGNRIVEYLVARTAGALAAILGLRLSQHHVIDLDSSSDTKFSRHLIFILPSGARFRDNLQAGRVSTVQLCLTRHSLPGAADSRTHTTMLANYGLSLPVVCSSSWA